jgi:hypothetical protein
VIGDLGGLTQTDIDSFARPIFAHLGVSRSHQLDSTSLPEGARAGYTFFLYDVREKQASYQLYFMPERGKSPWVLVAPRPFPFTLGRSYRLEATSHCLETRLGPGQSRFEIVESREYADARVVRSSDGIESSLRSGGIISIPERLRTADFYDY